MANDNYNSEFILKNGWPCFDGHFEQSPLPEEILPTITYKRDQKTQCKRVLHPRIPAPFCQLSVSYRSFFLFRIWTNQPAYERMIDLMTWKT